MKLLFIGDNHCDSRTPKFRNDDYTESCLSKITECLKIAENNAIDAVIFLGDIFDRLEVGAICRNRLLAILRQNEDKPWSFRKFVVVGNHDIACKPSYLEKSSLGSLIAAGVIECVDEAPEFGIKFLHYTPTLDEDIINGKLAEYDHLILAAHASITTHSIFGKYILFDDVELHPNTKLIVAGHIHQKMIATREDGVRFINPGHTGRTKLNQENLDRVIDVVGIKYEAGKFLERWFPLKTALASEKVFKIEEFNAIKAKKLNANQFLAHIDDFKTDNIHSKDIIKDLNDFLHLNKATKDMSELILTTINNVRNGITEDTTII